MDKKLFWVVLFMAQILPVAGVRATDVPAVEPCHQQLMALEQANITLNNVRLDHGLARAAVTGEVQAAIIQAEAIVTAKYEQARAAYMDCEQHVKAVK